MTSPAVQSALLFTVEMGPGVHEHMFTDVFLKDPSGKVLLVAKKQSLLHRDYTIIDGGGSITGFIEGKVHITHTSLTIKGANHDFVGTVQVSNSERRGELPKCWLEDAGGDKQASMLPANGVFGFSWVGSDGTRIFDAAFAIGGGVKQALNALERKSYEIELFDSGFSLPTLVTIIAAIDQ